jgi:hypothetical protein
MGRIGWWLLLLTLSVVVLFFDIVTGPYIQFPILFVVPVGLAGWYLGRRAGIWFAVALVALRLLIVLEFEAHVTPAWAALVNATIRVSLLVALALLLDMVSRQKATLAERVEALEGILPICSFCKKIRKPDGSWEQIESYVSHRSPARFSHGFCEECGRIHYGEYLDGDSPDGKPS